MIRWLWLCAALTRDDFGIWVKFAYVYEVFFLLVFNSVLLLWNIVIWTMEWVKPYWTYLISVWSYIAHGLTRSIHLSCVCSVFKSRESLFISSNDDNNNEIIFYLLYDKCEWNAFKRNKNFCIVQETSLSLVWWMYGCMYVGLKIVLRANFGKHRWFDKKCEHRYLLFGFLLNDFKR